MYLLGYLTRDHKVYLADREVHVYSYDISLEVLEFQTLTLRGELDDAMESILPNIQDKDSLLKISRFLEGQEFYEEALKISPDRDQKFDLALKIGDLFLASELLSDEDSDLKWKSLGDSALERFNFKLAIEAYESANDLDSLFLLYSSFNNKEKLLSVGERAEKVGKFNLAFNCYWVCSDIKRAQDLLVKSKRYSEAAIFGLTYGLDNADLKDTVARWKKQLVLDGKEAIAERICVPGEDEGFPNVTVSREQPLIDIETKAHEEVDLISDDKEELQKETKPEIEADDVDVAKEEEEEEEEQESKKGDSDNELADAEGSKNSVEQQWR